MYSCSAKRVSSQTDQFEFDLKRNSSGRPSHQLTFWREPCLLYLGTNDRSVAIRMLTDVTIRMFTHTDQRVDSCSFFFAPTISSEMLSGLM